MSFSDFGGPKRTNNSTGATASSVAAAPHSGNASIPTSSSNGGGPLSAISDSLLQYQRNVGILEKIVQSLHSTVGNAAASRSTATTETIQQYEAQKHVLSHLEDKVKQLFDRQQQLPPSSTMNAMNTSIVKLQRDFQRVQSRAAQLHETAAKSIASIQSNANQPGGGGSYNSAMGWPSFDATVTNSGENGGTDVVAEHQRLQQMQLQEDRLHEEIMREREEEIRNINKGMHTVNEIYKDLAHIVGQQQDHIDQIETQMEDSRANAESGLKQVEKANEKYGSSQCTVM